MKPQSLHEMLAKIEEVRTVFDLGQRAVPLLEEVVHFLREVSPLLDEINLSVEDTAHQMPSATSKLERVTKATELATNEILDLIDMVFRRLDTLRAAISEGARQAQATDEADVRLARLLRAELAGKDERLVSRIECLLAEKQVIRSQENQSYSAAEKTLFEIRSDVTRIMMSLQIQDITAQQIAAVNHLIQSIRHRMTVWLGKLNHAGETPCDVPSLDESQPRFAFDPEADYTDPTRRQVEADEMIRALEEGGGLPSSPEYAASQQEIDELFRREGPDCMSTDRA